MDRLNLYEVSEATERDWHVIVDPFRLLAHTGHSVLMSCEHFLYISDRYYGHAYTYQKHFMLYSNLI